MSIPPIIPGDDPLYPDSDPIFLEDDESPDPLGPGDIFDESAESDRTYPGADIGLSTGGLASLDSWSTSTAWDNTQSNVGFYVHSGNVYLMGSVTADGDFNPGSDVIFDSIPPEYCPVQTATGRVLVDHQNSTYEYAWDSGLKIGPWLNVTITPDGVMTLDDGNPIRPPGDPSVDFTYLSLILHDVNWPISGQTYDAYGNTGSLDDFVGTAANINAHLGSVSADIWNNIDGTYSAHDERLHLNGKVTVVGDWAGYPFDALLGIPPEYQVRHVSGASFAEIAQKDGYKFLTAPPSGSTGALISNLGSQMPAAAGNRGCGAWAPYFYEQVSDGFLTRGETATLLFTPAPSDVGVDYSGAKGSPVGDPGYGSSLFSDVADWRGMVYDVNFQCTINDLLMLGTFTIPTTVPPDYTLLTGANQHAFILGMKSVAPAMANPDTYLKIVFTFDSATGLVSRHTMLEQCGSGGGRALLSRYTFNPGTTSHTATIHLGFSLTVSSEPGDVGYTGPAYSGYNYYRQIVGGGHNEFSDYATTALVGTAPLPASKPKGDMGVHFPSGSSAKITLADISGLGSFPVWATGDVLDLTGCGWPIA